LPGTPIKCIAQSSKSPPMHNPAWRRTTRFSRFPCKPPEPQYDQAQNCYSGTAAGMQVSSGARPDLVRERSNVGTITPRPHTICLTIILKQGPPAHQSAPRPPIPPSKNKVGLTSCRIMRVRLSWAAIIKSGRNFRMSNFGAVCPL